MPTTMSCAVVSATVIGPSLRRSLPHAGLPLADPDRPLLGVLRLGQRQRQDAVLVLRVRVLRVDVGRQHHLLAELPAADALVEGPRPFRRRRLDRALQRHHVLTGGDVELVRLRAGQRDLQDKAIVLLVEVDALADRAAGGGATEGARKGVAEQLVHGLAQGHHAPRAGRPCEIAGGHNSLLLLPLRSLHRVPTCLAVKHVTCGRGGGAGAPWPTTQSSLIVKWLSTLVTPAPRQATRSASSRSAHARTVPRRMTVPSSRTST